MVPAMMAINTPPQSPGMRDNNSTLKVSVLFTVLTITGVIFRSINKQVLTPATMFLDKIYFTASAIHSISRD